MKNGTVEINKVAREWFTNANDIHISRPMLQSEALIVPKSLGNYRVKVPTGWFTTLTQHCVDEIFVKSKNVNVIFVKVLVGYRDPSKMNRQFIKHI